MSDESIHDEHRYALVVALEQARARGDVIDDAAWATRFDVDEAEVRRARAAVELLVDAEDPALGAIEIPPPPLPDDYELLEELGRGGMGVVYRVRQKSLDRELALKVLLPGERMLQRFRREAKSLARLRHPHIARLHEVGECEGRIYFTMDLIEGESLAARIASDSITPSQAVRWLRQVTSAVRYVHGHGLVHRDLKPANILIDEEGDACVVDFGLARDVEVSSELTASGHLLGTPAYMAPEQVRGESDHVGEATDVWALGAVLYECLTGRPAFRGESLVELVQSVCEMEPIPPRKLDPKIPFALEVICLEALAKDPARRYPTARALLEDLERFEAGRGILARPPGVLRQLRSFLSKNRAVLITTLVTTLALTAGFWFLVGPRLTPTDADRIALADQLLLVGEPGGALRLYDDVVGDTPAAELEPEFAARYARSLLERTDARLAEDPAAAARDYRRVLHLVATALANLSSEQEARRLPMACLSSLSARAAASLGDREAVRARLAEMPTAMRWDDSMRLRANDGDGQAASVVWGRRGNLEEGAMELARHYLSALSDFDDPHHDAAVMVWSELLSSNDHRTKIRRELAEGDWPREEVIVALLLAAPSVPEDLVKWVIPDLSEREHGLWTSIAEKCRREQVVEALRRHEVVGEGKRERWADQEVLLRFLVPYLDLPHVLEPQLLAEEAWTLCVLPHDEPSEDLAWRVRRVLALEGDMDFRVDTWLRAHTGAVPDTKEPADRPGWWRQWWEEQGHETPEQWLQAALGIEVLPSPEQWGELLPRFDAAEGPERRWLHELLRLRLPEGAEAPPWISNYGEPADLTAAWHAVFDATRESAPWRLRLAALRFTAGEVEPELRWSTELDARAGESVRFDFTVPVSLSDPPASGPEAVVRIPYSSERPETFVVPLRADLHWSRFGIGINWENRPGFSLHGMWARPSGVRGIQNVGIGRVCAPIIVALHRDRDRQPMAWDLLLSVLVPAEDPLEEMSVEDWRVRIADDVNERRLAAEQARREENHHFQPKTGPSLPHTLWLAGLLPDPARIDELRRLFDAYEEHVQGYDAFQGFRVTALLAAGDASPLDDPEYFQDRLEEGMRYASRSGIPNRALQDGYWERLLLGSHDPRIREEAARQLVGKVTRDRLVDLADRLQESGRPVPRTFEQWSDHARSNLDGKARQRFVLDVLLRFLKVGLLFLAALLVREVFRRHEDPLRGIYAGLFLMAVGFGLSLQTVWEFGGEFGRLVTMVMAALGAWALAARMGGRTRFFPPFCFSVAAFVHLVAMIWTPRGLEGGGGFPQLMLVTGVLGVPSLVHDMWRHSARRGALHESYAAILLGIFLLPWAVQAFDTAGILAPEDHPVWIGPLQFLTIFTMLAWMMWLLAVAAIKADDVERLRAYFRSR